MQQLPQAVSEQQRRQVGIAVATLAATRAAWSQMPIAGSWDDAWNTIGSRITAIVTAAQLAAARAAEPYVSSVLAETGQSTAAPVAVVSAASLAGTASDGRDLAALLYGAVVHAGEQYDRARRDAANKAGFDTRFYVPPKIYDRAKGDPRQALQSGRDWLDMAVQTQISDTARSATSLAIATRPWIQGYVRMLNLPSCSRCALLAGKFYLWDAGFERHPRCDCVEIPATEENERFGSVETNPNMYFDSLTREEQDKIFTKAGAEAIRDGADISQVVNARRGMQTAQLFGRDALITTTGTTKRGYFGGGHGGSKPGGYNGRNVGRRGAVANYVERTAKRARLMPESIYAAAKDRDDALRLLKLYGYIR